MVQTLLSIDVSSFLPGTVATPLFAQGINSPPRPFFNRALGMFQGSFKETCSHCLTYTSVTAMSLLYALVTFETLIYC